MPRGAGSVKVEETRRMCDVVCVPCCRGGAAPSSTATCSRRVVAAGVPWMAAADAGEATETAADCTMFFHGLPKVAAAGRLKPAVSPEEWAERELIEDDEPDEPDRCRPVAGPPCAATSLPHPQHGSSPTSRRLNRRGLCPCGRTHGGGRRSIPWSIHHSGRERSNHLLHLLRTRGSGGRAARPDHDDEVVAGRQQQPHVTKRLSQPPLPTVADHRIADSPRDRQPQPRQLRADHSRAGVDHKWTARCTPPHGKHPRKVARGQEPGHAWKAGPAGMLRHHQRS